VSRFEDTTFLLLVIAVTLLFAWILSPFFGAILWSVLLSIMFASLYRRLLAAMPRRRNLAAFTTLLIIVVMVLIPLALIAASAIREAANVFERFQSGEIDVGRYQSQFMSWVPAWLVELLNQLKLADLTSLRERLSSGLVTAGQYLAGQALSIGQVTAEFMVSLFVMLYLLFFLLRDGDALVARIKRATPLRADHQSEIFGQVAATIRATIKGDILVALIQGALGGLIFWLLGIGAAVLWAAVMAVLSLLPVLGSALVWVPVAIYLLLTGSVVHGIVLLVYGALVISLVDNFLRPWLVGKDIKMPSYIVLISTLGGLAVFGANGFVIGPLVAALFLVTWNIAAPREGERLEDAPRRHRSGARPPRE
jgi:predicted PurR-regulated permease PerM